MGSPQVSVTMPRVGLELRSTSVLLSMLAFACGPSGPSVLLVPEGPRSAILFTIEPRGVLARSLDLTRDSPLLAEVEGSSTVLFYERGLEEWALAEGELRLESTGRALEPFLMGFSLAADEDAWRSIEALPSELSELRLPPFDPIACVDAGRCVGPLESGARWCRAACVIDPTPEPAPPTPPDPLTDIPCPEGWARPTVAGVSGACRPPERQRSCPSDQAQWLGKSSCEMVGRACPVGTWPDTLIGRPGVIYVDAAAPSGGDGSMPSPFSTLEEALAAVSTTATIALSVGRYRVNGPLVQPVLLAGACVGGTVLEASSGSVVLEPRAELEIANLSIEGGVQGVRLVSPNVELRMRDVILSGTVDDNYAILLQSGARAHLERVVVRGRAGLRAEAGSSVIAHDLLLESTSSHSALSMVSGSNGRFSRLLASLEDRLPLSSPAALVATGNASVQLDQAWVRHTQLGGILVTDSSRLIAAHLWISRTQDGSDIGYGIYASLSSSVAVDGLGFEDHADPDAVVLDTSGMTLERVSSSSVEARKTAGFVAAESARMMVRRASLQSRGTAFDFFEHAQAEVEDLVLQTRPQPGSPNAVIVRGAAYLVGCRWRVDLEGGTGILLDSSARNIELDDIHVRGRTERGSVNAATALFQGLGALRLRRVMVELDGHRGLSLKSAASLEDVRVSGDLDFGLRLDALSLAGAITAARMAVSGRAGVDVEVIGGTRSTLKDVTIDGGVVGLRISETADVELQHFVIDSVPGQGVVLHNDGLTSGAPSLELHSGRLSRCEVGVSLVQTDVDRARLLEGLRFAENLTNVRIDLASPD